MTVTTTQTSPSHSILTGSVHQHQPSVASLVRSTAVAAAVAAVLAVTCVLPAEYAIDPTGVGHILGLTQMGEIKRDAETKLANGKKALLQSPSSVHFASGSHIISDAMPIGGAWARLAQAAPAAVTKAPAAKTKLAIAECIRSDQRHRRSLTRSWRSCGFSGSGKAATSAIADR